MVEANRDYWAQLASSNINNLALPYEKDETTNPILEKIARTKPYYERNLAHICSFWLKGECTRGALCTYRHDNPHKDKNLDNQNIKDRFYGVNDPVAKKILNQIENSRYLKAPDDKSIKTICISFVEETFLNDLEVVLKRYGTIDDMTLIKNHLFVSFAKRPAAEDAVKNIFTSLIIRGRKLNVVWCKKLGEDVDVSQKVHMKAGDGFLLPSFDFNLKAINGPKAPTKPPVDAKEDKDQDKFLMNQLKDKPKYYSSMKSDHFGGKKL